jgi:hypothetical protein
MAMIIESIKRSNSSRNILGDLVIPSLEITDIKSSAKKVAESRNVNNDAIRLIR